MDAEKKRTRAGIPDTGRSQKQDQPTHIDGGAQGETPRPKKTIIRLPNGETIIFFGDVSKIFKNFAQPEPGGESK